MARSGQAGLSLSGKYPEAESSSKRRLFPGDALSVRKFRAAGLFYSE